MGQSEFARCVVLSTIPHAPQDDIMIKTNYPIQLQNYQDLSKLEIWVFWHYFRDSLCEFSTNLGGLKYSFFLNF